VTGLVDRFQTSWKTMRSAGLAAVVANGQPGSQWMLLMLALGRVPVLVVQVPPLVGRSLRIALGRVLPLLLAPEGGDVEVAPRAAHRLVAAVVDEIGAVDLLAIAQERVRPVPL